MGVELIQSVTGMNRTESWPSHEQGEILSAWLPSSWDASFFPAFGIQVKHRFILNLEFASLYTGIYIVSSLASQTFRLRLKSTPTDLLGPTCQLQISGLISPHNCATQFIINCIICVCVCVCVCVCIVHTYTHICTHTHRMDRSLPVSFVCGILQKGFWSGLPFSSPGDLPDPGTEPTSPISPALEGGFFTTSATWEAYIYM